MHIWYLGTRQMYSLPVWGPDASNSFSELKWRFQQGFTPWTGSMEEPFSACLNVFDEAWHSLGCVITSSQFLPPSSYCLVFLISIHFFQMTELMACLETQWYTLLFKAINTINKHPLSKQGKIKVPSNILGICYLGYTRVKYHHF